jgi:hypothetical protein
MWRRVPLLLAVSVLGIGSGCNSALTGADGGGGRAEAVVGEAQPAREAVVAASLSTNATVVLLRLRCRSMRECSRAEMFGRTMGLPRYSNLRANQLAQGQQ